MGATVLKYISVISTLWFFLIGSSVWAANCHVDYKIVNDWGSGFQADVKIRNKGNTLYGWNVEWDMPNQQAINHLWNGQKQQSGSRVSISNLNWNRTIYSNGMIQFGFLGQANGLNQVPNNITLNGELCDGQVAPPPPLPIACEVDYHIRTQWNVGFVTDVTIKNTGAPLAGWDVTWSMPNGQAITQLWNGQHQQNADKVSVKNLGWNQNIDKDANIKFGFVASRKGLNPKPIDLAVNGVRCEGQADSIVLPPAPPSNLVVKLVDNKYARLTWQDESHNEDSIVVQRREKNANWATIATLDANTSSSDDNNMVVGKAYEYRVQSLNATAASEFTNIASAERQDRLDIRAPILASTCASCHGTDGVSSEAIPTLSGMDRDYFIRTMKAYQDGSRASTVMDRIAKGYTDTQIERMAEFFAAKTFVSAVQEAEQALVNKGRQIHQQRCIVCHTGVGENMTVTKTRLDGQLKTYLEGTLEDYFSGKTSNTPNGMAASLVDIKQVYGDDALVALAEFYAASAEAKAGGTPEPEEPPTGDPNTKPNAPKNLTSQLISNEQIQLLWQDASNNEEAFRIERRHSENDAWQILATVGNNTTRYTDAAVQAGITYQYQVIAVNAQGDSDAAILSASLLTPILYGERMYQEMNCASCHGKDGKGGFTNVPLTQYTSKDLAHLTQINSTTMPQGNPDVCVGNCALAISQYIIDVLAVNATNGGDDNPQTCQASAPASERSLRLLTRYEYQNTVNDLLGLSVHLINSLPEENRVEGFDNNIETNLVTAGRLESFLLQAENLATKAVQDNWSQLISCSQQNQTCANDFIASFGKLAYRRPLTTQEQAQYSQAFAQVNDFEEAVRTTIMRMLVSPNFLYRSELGELQADGTYQLTPYEIASSLSYLFIGSMPDAELMQAADNDELSTSAQRIAQASRLLNEPRSREQIGNFVGQWLLSASPYSLPDKDLNVYPAYTSEVREAMSKELITFFNHVAFDSSHQFSELFAADYVIANKTLADFYQLSGATTDSFELTPVTDNTRTGVLTLGAVLARYANSAESHPFKRGAFFFERVLCHDLPAPENAGIVAAPTPDPNMTTRERFDFHSKSNASCYSCHQYLDGPGFAFENYDGSGQFRSLENGNPIDASGILRGMETYTPDEELSFTDLKYLSQLVSNSDNAAQCLGRQYYRYTVGRMETAADKCALDHFLGAYKDNGYNLQTMLLGIVNAPNFTVRRAD